MTSHPSPIASPSSLIAGIMASPSFGGNRRGQFSDDNRSSKKAKKGNFAEIVHVDPRGHLEEDDKALEGFVLIMEGRMENKACEPCYAKEDKGNSVFLEETGVVPFVLNLQDKDDMTAPKQHPPNYNNKRYDYKVLVWTRGEDEPEITKANMRMWFKDIFVPSLNKLEGVKELKEKDQWVEPELKPDFFRTVDTWSDIIYHKNMTVFLYNVEYPKKAAHTMFKENKGTIYSVHKPGTLTREFIRKHSLSKAHVYPADYDKFPNLNFDTP